MEQSLEVEQGRSLMLSRKRTGPRTVPCGIPDLGLLGVDKHPLPEHAAVYPSKPMTSIVKLCSKNPDSIT